jgi:hypothetical protein
VNPSVLTRLLALRPRMATQVHLIRSVAIHRMPASLLQSKLVWKSDSQVGSSLATARNRYLTLYKHSLLESATDEKLCEALTAVFGQYGTVFIKIKRKANNMPYAFIQYTVSLYGCANGETGMTFISDTLAGHRSCSRSYARSPRCAYPRPHLPHGASEQQT